MSFVETNKSIDALLEELDIKIEDFNDEESYEDNFYDEEIDVTKEFNVLW